MKTTTANNNLPATTRIDGGFRFLKCATLSLLATFSVSALIAGPANYPMAKATVDHAVMVRQIKGTPSYSTDGSSWNAVVAGYHIPAGATVRSPVGSEAVLDMELQGSMVKVSSGTEVVLQKSDGQIAREESETRSLAGSSKIRAIRGRAQIFANDAWHTLSVNSILKRGSIVRTEANSTLDMIFLDKGLFVRMTPSTVVRIEQLAFHIEGMIPVTGAVMVLQGSIETNGRQALDGGTFEMKATQVLYRVKALATK